MSEEHVEMDSPTDIRSGEDLDRDALDQFLRSAIGNLAGSLYIQQFPGGASNLTYLLKYNNMELVLRRPPFGRIAKSAHNMLREANVIETVGQYFPYAPKVMAKSDDHSIMGCDFFVMERIRGIVPRKDIPQQWQLNFDDTREFCVNGLEKLIELHTIDTHKPELTKLGKGAGYVQRQISGWTERWRKAITPDAAGFEKVIQWLHDKQPSDVATCIIHNDFRFDNLVYSLDTPTEVVGVLDWEMSTLGDPLMDLGNSMAYWVQADDPDAIIQARLQPTHAKGMMTRREAIDYYLDRCAYTIDSFDFYEIYGLFRLAVIAQQIYYRFFHGQTTDKRFGGFAKFAYLLEQRCLQKIANSE